MEATGVSTGAHSAVKPGLARSPDVQVCQQERVRGVGAVDARRRKAGRRPSEELEEGRRVVQQEPREHAEGGCGRGHTTVCVQLSKGQLFEERTLHGLL